IEAGQSAAAETTEAPPASEAEAGMPDWLRPEAMSQYDATVPADIAEPAAAAAPAAEPAALPDWLREMEAAMPVEPLVDTAPSKGRRAAEPETVQAPLMPEPAAMEAPSLAEAPAASEVAESMQAEAAEPAM